MSYASKPAGAGRRTRSPGTKPPSALQLASLKRKAARGFIARWNKELGNDAAEWVRVCQNRARLKARLDARRGGFPPPDLRKDPLADRDIFQETLSALGKGDVVRLASRRAPSVERRSYPVHTPTWENIEAEKRKRRRLGTSETVLWVPHADHTGDKLKALSWAMALEDTDECVAFTLRLHPHIISKALGAEGAASFLLNRINKSLTRQFDQPSSEIPMVFFVLEKGPFDELHIHGVIQVEKAEKALRKALLESAGFNEARLTGTELRFRSLYWAPGWINYITKWVGPTEQLLGSTAFAASQRVRTAGRAWFAAARAGEKVLLPETKQQEAGMIDLDTVDAAEAGPPAGL